MDITVKEKKMLKGSVDLSISTLASQIPSLQDEEQRIEARQTVKELIDLTKKIETIKTK